MAWIVVRARCAGFAPCAYRRRWAEWSPYVGRDGLLMMLAAELWHAVELKVRLVSGLFSAAACRSRKYARHHPDSDRLPAFPRGLDGTAVSPAARAMRGRTVEQGRRNGGSEGGEGRIADQVAFSEAPFNETPFPPANGIHLIQTRCDNKQELHC